MKRGYVSSEVKPLDFEVAFRIEAVVSERQDGDGARRTEEVDVVAEAVVKDELRILYERGEYAACDRHDVDGEGARVARRLQDAVVAEESKP